MIENVTHWSGASGEEYKYYVYEIGTSFQDCPGNYIFAKLTGLGDWLPIYIGKTASLNGRLSCHDKMPSISRHGATHVHENSSDDEEIEMQIQESPYLQAFCGFEDFQTEKLFAESSLCRVRKRIGAKFFQELEKKTYDLLVEKKIIRGEEMLVDATVYPEAIRYPTDVGLLNRAREWLVDKIDEIGKKVGERPRTYKRKARQAYLDFSKKRRKTQQAVKDIKKALLQYVRRNIKELDDLIMFTKARGEGIGIEVKRRLKIVRRVYEQQREMYREKSRRVENRIVSLHKPEVRPIIRGKAGKKVEFGPKVALSHVDGFVFMDHMSHENFNEALLVPRQIDLMGIAPVIKAPGSLKIVGLVTYRNIFDAYEKALLD